jgi:hypothetical protein
MQADWDSDPRARGAFSGTLEAQPSGRNTKSQGSLPLTGASATAFTNGQSSSATGPLRGIYWEFLASGGYDVSSDTRIMVYTVQFNAPNRIQMATASNNGFVVRLGSGSGSPPANYRTWQVGGNDVFMGKSREFPRMIVIDLNDSTYDAEIGTFDNTDIQCFGQGTVRFDIVGGSTNFCYLQRLFVFETTKNATNIPRFTGSNSDWDDIITALGTTYTTKISHEWIAREGNVFSLACPVEIGNNSSITTFNDNGASVFWSNANDATDPRVRITENAFRVYLNLRNNASDTATFSGFYNAGNSYPPWNFDQDDSAVVTFNNPTFKRTGRFDVGSSITGPAVFDDCGVVYFNDSGVDLDGSTFKNPNTDHLVRLEA